jgi:transcription antitermination factor NusG
MFDYRRLDNCWLAVQVRSGWEFRTAEALRTSGYEEFVPSYLQKRQRAGSLWTVSMPLFSGYVFFRFEACNPRPVLFIPGVMRFVGTGNCPVPIDKEEIESLRVASQARADWGPYPFLGFNDMVEIHNGPLAGLKGKIIKFKNKNRLIISVNLICKSVFVEIQEDDVTRILPHEPALKFTDITGRFHNLRCG